MTDIEPLDHHVIIAAPSATYTPSGHRVTGPVTSVDQLETLITYAVGKRQLLQPFLVQDGEPAPARLWLIGGAAAKLTGAATATDRDLHEEVGRVLGALVGRGWQLSGAPDRRFVLTRADGPRPIAVEVVVEPQPWLGAGTITDDHTELGRRLGLWHAALGVLPASTAAASGAVLLDQIMRSRAARRSTAAILSAPGALPSGVTPELWIQPPWAGPIELVEAQLDRAVDLVLLEQQFPHLASAGMLTLGYGTPDRVQGHAAAAAAGGTKRPFGLWRALLPAADTIAQPELLPAAHPRMHPNQATRVWVCSEDLDGLTKAVRDGGAGLSVEQLDIDAAVLWPRQSRLLEAWGTLLREALETAFAGEPALCALVEAVGGEYTTAMADPDLWTGEWRHHYQPAIAASIAAHIRFRARRVAMRLAREFRVQPLCAYAASMIYAVGCDEDTEQPIDLSDTHTRLGRVEITRRVPLTDETVLAVALAETDAEVADALTGALSLPAQTPRRPETTVLPVSNAAGGGGAQASDAEQAGAGPDSAPRVAEDTVSASGTEAPDTEQPAAPSRQAAATPARGAATRRKSKGKSVKPTAPAAAVLHTDGLWLPDGSRIELADFPTHVGHVAELAYTHNIGYPLSESYCEPGQIWITEAACEAFGIDVVALAEEGPIQRGPLLHELTENLAFVTDAVADGWRMGGGGEDKTVQRLGVWTRVFLEGSDRAGVWIVLIAGMDTFLSADALGDEDDDDETYDKGVPILAGRPTPGQVARRLQLLAEAMDFPFKINRGVTAIDMLVQSRPKTWTVKEWREVVLAPSTTELPYGIGDVERDFFWTRTPTAEESKSLYLHAYDRGGSYFAALGTLELPIGDPIHHPNGTKFDPKVPGFWLVDVPDNENWFMPYLLNPSGYQFNEPKWVSTPRIEMAFKFGYELDMLEALVWPRHGRIFRLWTERFANASVVLDTDDPDAQAARNQSKSVRSPGLGVMASDRYLKGKLGYHPARRALAVGKANANIAYGINKIGQATGRWPVAADHDTVLYVSNDPDPDTAWPGGPQMWGRTFGKYKHEGSAMLEEHLEFLDGAPYRGKNQLTAPEAWRDLIPTLIKGDN